MRRNIEVHVPDSIPHLKSHTLSDSFLLVRQIKDTLSSLNCPAHYVDMAAAVLPCVLDLHASFKGYLTISSLQMEAYLL